MNFPFIKKQFTIFFIPALSRFLILFSIGLTGVVLPLLSHASLTSKTQIIQGKGPRFSTAIEGDIQAEAENFPYFGIRYRDTNYFSQEELDSALATSLNIAGDTPDTLGLTVAYQVPKVVDTTDSDGDVVSELTGEATVNWYYSNQGSEQPLSSAQLKQDFCQLNRNGIVPYIKISGLVILRTQYGSPRDRHYPDGSLIPTPITHDPIKRYDISPEIGVCYAKPYLKSGSGGSPTMWSPTGGFLVQSQRNPDVNFPTTGFNGAFFDLNLLGVDATKLDWNNADVTQGNITAKVNLIDSSTVRVTLVGPSSGTKAGQPAPSEVALPAIFMITDSANTVEYRFKLKQWFIIHPSRGAYNTPTGAVNYCTTLAGGAYRVPTRAEYTNAYNITQPPYSLPVGTIGGENDGTASFNPDNYYKRTIGGGVMTEWGELAFGYYANSEWANNYYWTSEAWSHTNQYSVYASLGNLSSDEPDNIRLNIACVSR